MLSFASVAIRGDGERLGEFEACLAPLADAQADPVTTAFWQKHPEAYAAATTDPQPAEHVMAAFIAWVRQLPGEAIFAAHPLALDGVWIEYYLTRFTNDRILEGFWREDRAFRTAPVCIASFAAGRLGWPFWRCKSQYYPTEWLGDHPHTHRAIDDARGYASLLTHLLRLPAGQDGEASK
jgi:hypothetical protein